MAFLWLINGGDPNHLLTGMILQVGHVTAVTSTRGKPWRRPSFFQFFWGHFRAVITISSKRIQQVFFFGGASLDKKLARIRHTPIFLSKYVSAELQTKFTLRMLARNMHMGRCS